MAGQDDAEVRGARVGGRGSRPDGQCDGHGFSVDGDQQGVGGLDARHGAWWEEGRKGPTSHTCEVRGCDTGVLRGMMRATLPVTMLPFKPPRRIWWDGVAIAVAITRT